VAVIPVARALFLCKEVIFEDRTRNVSLINCFNRLRVPEIPGTVDPFYVYARLINGSGRVALRITVDPLDTMHPIYDQPMEFTFQDRTTEVDLKFRVVSCQFPRPGRYSVNLYADSDLVAQTEIEVIPKEV
jgi:hypothetical protein